jgi:regulator of sigma E protease
MITLLAFLVAIGLLVTFHELGHYSVAKLCGVKVLRFSIGFGKPFYTWNMFDTEWAVCPVLLGGYVRMLDEREAAVPEADRHRSFNVQSPLRRMAIVAAGPLANLLLAALLYWVVVAHGVVQMRPWVGTVVAESPAASAGFQPGDRLLAVNGQSVTNWNEARLAMLDAMADMTRVLNVAVQTPSGPVLRKVDVPRFKERYARALESGEIGALPVRYLAVVGSLEPGGVAQTAGLKSGDRLLSVDGQPLSSWQGWVSVIRDNPGKLLNLSIERAGKVMNIPLRPALLQLEEGFVGHIGAGPQIDSKWLQTLQYTQRADVLPAALQAVQKTGDTSWMSLKFLGRMLIGESSMDNLSGPLVIANIAGQTARQGLIAYLEFLALISVSIGVLNLLPIPVLDGGHLMYYTAELIRGKPLSERIQQLGQRFGFSLLIALMAFAMFNDISRLFGG